MKIQMNLKAQCSWLRTVAVTTLTLGALLSTQAQAQVPGRFY